VLGPAWSPLATANSSSGTGTTGGMQPGGGPGGGTRDGMPGPMGMIPGGGGGTGLEKKDGAPTRRRYEFVIMFLWREPTPSGSPALTTPTDPNAVGGSGS
jgi:hypothetical protein